MTGDSRLLPSRLLGIAAHCEPHERKAALLSFACNFVLLASYYILRPLRDTMGTVFGVNDLQNLFTGTFILIFLCAPLFSWMAAHLKLERLLPGVFWFLSANLLLFYFLFHLAPDNRWVAGAFFCWFSAINLIVISVFWTLMADIYSSDQATRLYALIAAGGSLGAIMGPIIIRFLVRPLGVDGLLLVAMAGFLLVVFLVHRLMREKQRLLGEGQSGQDTTLDHTLPGDPLRGFQLLLKSGYLMGQAVFMLLMTWVATILYFIQADFIAGAYSAVEQRAIAFADVDLFVNVGAVLILVLGLGRMMNRFGVTACLVLTPALMAGAFAALLAAPTLFMVQAARALQRITQYGVARPAREVLFTVINQQQKYKAKNVSDTVVYRFGDLTAAWLQAGMKAGGVGFAGVMAAGVAVSAAWGFVAFGLGRRYRALGGARAGAPAAMAAE